MIEHDDGERTAEEDDLLVRSTKKAKGGGLADTRTDANMQSLDETQENSVGEKESMQGQGPEQENLDPNIGRMLVRQETLGERINEEAAVTPRKVLSYRDKLLEFNGGNDHEDDTTAIMEDDAEPEEVRALDSNTINMEEDDEDPACPVVQIAEEEMVALCKPWKLSLIVKLLGKKIGMRFLHARLQKMWAIQGSFEFIDMDNDYYLVRFTNVKDFNFVLQEGPWVVADHYLIVQRWKRNFDPYRDEFGRTAVWVRIPGLPIEFYNKHFLWRLGNRIGKTIKVDGNTLRMKEPGLEPLVERAKFARICIEIDLQKRFLAKFKLLNRIYRVEYEGLHLICFQCGKYGHKKEACPELAHTAEGRMQPKGIEADDIADRREVGFPVDSDRFGPWMITKKGRKPKRATVPARAESKGNPNHGSGNGANKENIKGDGSRFSVLMDIDKDGPNTLVVEPIERMRDNSDVTESSGLDFEVDQDPERVTGKVDLHHAGPSGVKSRGTAGGKKSDRGKPVNQNLKQPAGIYLGPRKNLKTNSGVVKGMSTHGKHTMGLRQQAHVLLNPPIPVTQAHELINLSHGKNQHPLPSLGKQSRAVQEPEEQARPLDTEGIKEKPPDGKDFILHIMRREEEKLHSQITAAPPGGPSGHSSHMNGL